MAETNLFEEMKDALEDFKSFLDQNIGTIRPAVQAIAAMIPEVNDFIDQLAGVLDQLKTKINELNTNIPGLTEATEFTGKVTSFLETAKSLVPDAASEIDAVLETASVVTSLPSLDQVKTEILNLLDAIIAHVNSLKSA